MATTKSATRPASPSTNGESRRRVIELDFEAAVAESDAPETVTRSPLRTQLEKLMQATLDGRVPRDESGALKFVTINRYTNASGAQTALKGLKDKPDRVPGDRDRWQFRKVVNVVEGKTVSALLARYIELDAE